MCDEYVQQQQVELGEPGEVPLRYLLGLCPVQKSKYTVTPKYVASIYLFESMIDDGRQIRFRNLGEHFTHSTADVILCAFLGCWVTMQRPSR